ncbi:hypothetical protein PseAD21_25610 [Pseudomonas sp. AD21]|uniref:hypothetical protein n=1 Tax=Pseudomonas sp. AD21 TaxID=396378 RepID=UPI000C81C181|nr:hypothetical protein [Pseudomonas sp. AD21]PMQ08160.1 hypothetical protein PseAD21_25610 [Pseudomonas sp. AD21]
MDPLHDIQILQLRLIESASVSESCATDLLGILRKLTITEAKNVVDIIGLLQNEAERLRELSKALTARGYAMLDC